MIDTRTQWLTELERLCPSIASYNLSTTQKPSTYVDRPENAKPIFRDADAYNLANSGPHNELVAHAIQALQTRMLPGAIQTLLGELTYRNTYGAFSELMAYKWLHDAGIDFKAQMPMTGSEVINPNGSTLDGIMTLVSGKTVGFDVKGFGFIEHKIKLLKERLEKAVAGKSVLIEGGYDVSIDALQELNEQPNYSALLTELQARACAFRGTLTFRVQDRRPVTITASESNPLQLAQENREYPLRFASQYTRKIPFLLVFVIHPWFSQGMLHQNFSGYVDHFTDELAKLAFLSFESDGTLVEGVPRSEAAKLLSGLVFLNAWPSTGTDAPRPQPFCRVLINSRALHPLQAKDFSAFQSSFGTDIVIRSVGDDHPGNADASQNTH